MFRTRFLEIVKFEQIEFVFGGNDGGAANDLRTGGGLERHLLVGRAGLADEGACPTLLQDVVAGVRRRLGDVSEIGHVSGVERAGLGARERLLDVVS